MDDKALMDKYQLSEKSLQSIFKKLLDMGVLRQEEFDIRSALLTKKQQPEHKSVQDGLQKGIDDEQLKAAHKISKMGAREGEIEETPVSKRPEESEQTQARKFINRIIAVGAIGVTVIILFLSWPRHQESKRTDFVPKNSVETKTERDMTVKEPYPPTNASYRPDCYEIGYKYGYCGTQMHLTGRSKCPSDYKIPEECRGRVATKDGIDYGVKSAANVWNEIILGHRSPDDF